MYWLKSVYLEGIYFDYDFCGLNWSVFGVQMVCKDDVVENYSGWLMKLKYLLRCACLEQMYFDFDFDLGDLNVKFCVFAKGMSRVFS